MASLGSPMSKHSAGAALRYCGRPFNREEIQTS